MSRSKVLYSGPYFDGREIEAAVATLQEGAWYPAEKKLTNLNAPSPKSLGSMRHSW
jgi:hypothetical protein